MFARSHKMWVVFTLLTWGRREGERLSLSPHRLGGEMADTLRPFSSPEPVVSWSLGLETMGSGSSCYRMSKISDIRSRMYRGYKYHCSCSLGIFSLTAPLGKKFYFLSPLQRVDSLGCFENTDFTQLGFTNNLESKEEDINKNQLNTLLGCRTEAINRQIIVWV